MSLMLQNYQLNWHQLQWVFLRKKLLYLRYKAHTNITFINLNLRETADPVPSLVVRNTKEIQTAIASADKQNISRLEWKGLI